MEDLILEKDIRRFFLGNTLYTKCIAGYRIPEKDLLTRVGQLHLRDPIFKNIDISDLVRLCGLKSSEENSMDIDLTESQDDETPDIMQLIIDTLGPPGVLTRN